jgi:hypothetical protein
VDDQEFKALVQKAWDLYALLQNMQKSLNQMFFEKFMDLDEERQRMLIQQEEHLY